MVNPIKDALREGVALRDERQAEAKAQRERNHQRAEGLFIQAVKKHRPLIEACLREILPSKVKYAAAAGERHFVVEVSLRTYREGESLTPLGEAINEIGVLGGTELIEEICRDMGFEHVRSESWSGMAPGYNFHLTYPESWEHESDAAST